MHLISLFTCLLLLITSSIKAQKATNLPRLVILADMGNEPDEEQQMMHLLMYANTVDLEALIAVTGKFLRPESNIPYRRKLHPELFHRLIDGYAAVLPSLKRHAMNWPTADYLHSIVCNGQAGYGIAATGPDQASPGSERLIEILTRPDPRPVYVVVNAGSNTLAQALTDYRRAHGAAATDTLISKLRIYENGAQDDAGAWLCHEFPDLHWVRSNYQTYCYGGPSFDGAFANQGKLTNLGPHTWQPYAYSALGQHQWSLEHVMGGHGKLGMLYPLRRNRGGRLLFLEGGGTIPWLQLVYPGLADINHPHWGGWSGRYTKSKQLNVWSKHESVKAGEQTSAPFWLYTEAEDRWIDPTTEQMYQSNFSPVWRWRQAYFDDFRARMDWCVSKYNEANHHPRAVLDGDGTDAIVFRKSAPGERITFSAIGSTDPDGDELSFHWYWYPEAGTFPGAADFPEGKQQDFSFQAPTEATELHLILEVRDKSEIVPLRDYRRIVIRVE